MVDREEKNCPLCGEPGAGEFLRDRLRRFNMCVSCGLVFVHPEDLPTREDEKRRYDLHRNDPNEPGYRAFLCRLLDVMVPMLRPGAAGLDYGSGPGPAVYVILAERGFRVANYDPFYAVEPGLLEKTYDFVTCTETVEHFHDPASEWPKMLDLVKGGGMLGVMTTLIPEDVDFIRWRYKDDITHVSFYGRRTMEWIAKRYGLDAGFHGDDVIVFRKRG